MEVVKVASESSPYLEYTDYIYDIINWGATSSQYLYEILPSINWTGNNLFENMAIDYIECNDKFIFNIDLPGIDKKDIEIELEKGIITVSAERIEIQGVVYHSKRNSGKCKRVINVPENTRDTDITIHYSQGVLNIIVTKYDELTRKLRIKQRDEPRNPPQNYEQAQYRQKDPSRKPYRS